jgi:AcrR family transcriptional regulator
MHTPLRILRADAEALERDPPELTPREQEQYLRILNLAEGIIVRRGVHTMTLSSLAGALCIGAGTVRRHFADLDILLATLISRHLRKLAYAINKVPENAADRPRKMRAAYLAYTRTIEGGYTEAHQLLVRDRHLLPDDLLANIEATRGDLGNRLANAFSEDVLTLLDLRTLDASRIEATLATIIATAPKQPKPAAPAPKPAAAPPRRDQPLPARPPWAPRDPLALFRFGPVPTLPNLAPTPGRPLIHSSA